MSDATQDHPSRVESIAGSRESRDADTMSGVSESGHGAAATPHDRPGRLRRMVGAAGVVAMVAGSTVAFAPAAAAAISHVPESAAARTAVAELTGDRPADASIPADFQARQGYRPVVADGLLIDPSGGCSSPIPLPPDFENACKAHDLGYDLLRYADRDHQPLGPWARQAVDAALEQRMYAACGTHSEPLDRTRCEVLASVATTAVDLNSRRQNYATPVPEYVFGTELSGTDIGHQVVAPAAGALAALLALIFGIRRARRRGFGPAAVLRRRPRVAC
ncbi:hypothetical protein [Nocardia blacklockiae]|uniref:hypothetical protein n=1 Tax=Nocardia blacklockiae TaxID=480036 RepID=UPI0018935645|nr:hypothetical protein [Nocardia blacklockiae]MBF6173649.1 hypothetical protein [Nocardia blacklockiae]